MNPNHGIYVIANTDNAKIYVGKTKQGFDERWHRHVVETRYLEYRAGKTYFKKAIRKHGPDKFHRAAWIQIGDDFLQRHNFKIDDVLNDFEKSAIAVTESWKPEKGYNGTMGGEGGPQTPEAIAKRSAALRGKPRSLETRAKISAAKKGQIPWSKGKTFSDEYRAKIRANMIRQLATTDLRSRVSEANRKRVHTAESRAKMAVVARRLSHNRFHAPRNIIKSECEFCKTQIQKEGL